MSHNILLNIIKSAVLFSATLEVKVVLNLLADCYTFSSLSDSPCHDNYF